MHEQGPLIIGVWQAQTGTDWSTFKEEFLPRCGKAGHQRTFGSCFGYTEPPCLRTVSSCDEAKQRYKDAAFFIQFCDSPRKPGGLSLCHAWAVIWLLQTYPTFSLFLSYLSIVNKHLAPQTDSAFVFRESSLQPREVCGFCGCHADPEPTVKFYANNCVTVPFLWECVQLSSYA